jgi:hypothetical protein
MESKMNRRIKQWMLTVWISSVLAFTARDVMAACNAPEGDTFDIDTITVTADEDQVAVDDSVNFHCKVTTTPTGYEDALEITWSGEDVAGSGSDLNHKMRDPGQQIITATVTGVETNGPCYKTANVTVDVYKVAFAIDEDKVAWSASGAYDAKAKMTSDSYNVENLQWTITTVEGAPATISGDGLVSVGAGGGKYTVHAVSKDLAVCEDSVTLNVIKVDYSIDEDKVAWSASGTYDAKVKMTSDSYNIENLQWTITTVEGPPAIISGDGLVSVGAGGGKYTVHVVSKDLSICEDSMTLYVLKVKSIDVWDSENRHAAGGCLQVVPTSLIGEIISGKAIVEPINESLSEFPIWQQDGSTPEIGLTASYYAYSSSLSSMLNFLPAAISRDTVINCMEKEVVINAYPGDKRSVKLDCSEINELATKIDTAVGMVLRDFAFDGPKGVVSFENQWKECPSSNLAYWTFDAQFGLDPVFGCHAKIPFGPGAAIPGWLKKWVDASFFVEFEGKSTLMGSKTRNECGEFDGIAKLTGEVSGELGVNILVFTEDFIRVDVTGGTGITGEGEIAVSEAQGIILKNTTVTWDGITAKVSVRMSYGYVEFDKEWHIADAKVIYGPTDVLLHAP